MSIHIDLLLWDRPTCVNHVGIDLVYRFFLRVSWLPVRINNALPLELSVRASIGQQHMASFPQALQCSASITPWCTTYQVLAAFIYSLIVTDGTLLTNS